MEDRVVSLADASKRAGIPQERLRRAILLGELVAETVPDDREYLIQAIHLESFAQGTSGERPGASTPSCVRRKVAIAIGIVLLLAFLALLGWLQTKRTGPFASLPPINSVKARSYKVAPYLREARRLQAIGREAACQELLKAAAQAPTCEQDEQIIILCRMLFTKRPGSEFRCPMLGAPACLGQTDYCEWPLEPIEILDSIPFLIVRGYMLGGEPEPASCYLRYCLTDCDWSSTAFQERTPKELRSALDKLLSSPTWKQPLDEYDRAFLSDQID